MFADLKAWYAYNGFETDQKGQSTRSFPPAAHKAGLTARIFLNSYWTFNTNYSYQNGVKYAPGIIAGLDTCNRLDLTLSRKFAKGKGEFMVGLADVLNEDTNPVFHRPGCGGA